MDMGRIPFLGFAPNIHGCTSVLPIFKFLFMCGTLALLRLIMRGMSIDVLVMAVRLLRRCYLALRALGVIPRTI